jgi:hypothetical protein
LHFRLLEELHWHRLESRSSIHKCGEQSTKNGFSQVADGTPWRIKMGGAMNLMLRRFPAYKDVIFRQMSASARFRTMCIDYKEALDTLEKWERTATPQGASYVKDYRRLVAELEREILDELLDNDV